MSERMSEERLGQLRETAYDSEFYEMDVSECVREIDALRAELSRAEQVRKWEMGQECRRSDCANVRAEIDALRAKLAEAERNWAEQEKRGTIAQTDLNIALNKLAAAERERDEYRDAMTAYAGAMMKATAAQVDAERKLAACQRSCVAAIAEAEQERDRARADALEEAAQMLERARERLPERHANLVRREFLLYDAMCIRALKGEP